MRRTLRACLALFKIRAAEGLQYRLAAFSGAAVSVFWVLIHSMILTVFYRYGSNAGGENGLTLSQGITYIWLGEMFMALQHPGIDGGLRRMITSGDIGLELCRPLDFYWHWFSRASAGKVSVFFLRGGAVVIFGIILYLAGSYNIGVTAPRSFLHFLLFLLSSLLAFIFSAAFGMFLISVRTGVVWGDGPVNMIADLGTVFSGALFPLQLWPDFMQGFLRLQPFASYLDTPMRLYVGSATIEDGLFSMTIQLIWIAAFILFGKTIMNRKLKNIVVQGG